MKEITHASALVVAVFLLASALTPPIKADIFDDNGNRLASGPYILDPVNTTYSSKIITLNLIFSTKLFFNVPLSATYSLDGTPNVIVPLVSSPSLIWNKNRVEGSVTLPELSDGSHTLSVYVEARLGTGSSYWDSETVYFTVETTPPKIILPIVSFGSAMNKTFNNGNITLDFTANKPLSKVIYSLDNQQNQTADANSPLSLNNLPNGEHKVTIFGQDENGNIGHPSTVYFSVYVFPTLYVAAISSLVLVIILAAGLLIYHKKRKNSLVKNP